MESIGSQIKRLRKNKGLTQEQLAPKVGLSRSTLSNYELNRRTPHLNELKRLAQYFGVGIEFFTGSVQDEAFDLLVRARNVFASDQICRHEKEALYTEFVKLYLKMKEDN